MTEGEHPTARLEAWLDGELGASEAAAVEAHVKTCGSCAAQAGRQRALRAAIRRELPPVPAPDVLRARVRDALREAAPRAGPVRLLPWRGIGVAAMFVVAVAAAWVAARYQASGERLTGELLAAHVRSLMPGHLTDVTSTDRHTVKPWFDGRLDYAPPVVDESAAGFPLLGGRLDYVEGRTVAALVYGRRLHRINVFVWPARGPSYASSATTRNGFNLEHWTLGGMEFWAVSDLAAPELDEFVRLLQQPDTSGVGRPPGAAP